MTEEEWTPPALYNHAVTIYNAMLEEAQTDESGTSLVYEGFLTKLFTEQGFSVPYYTTVMRLLKRLGCVTQLRRGGASTPSRWQIETEPTVQLYIDRVGEDEKSPTALRRTRMDGLEAQNMDLNRRVNKLEENVDLLLNLHEDKNVHITRS